MSYKELGVPFVPFCLEFLVNYFFQPATSWWLYVDLSTMVLTLSIWAMFLVSATPLQPPIPTDDSVKDDLIRVRSNFQITVIVGFCLFGVSKCAIAISKKLPDQKDYFDNVVFYYLFWWSLIFCIVNLIAVLRCRKSINNLVGAL